MSPSRKEITGPMKSAQALLVMQKNRRWQAWRLRVPSHSLRTFLKQSPALIAFSVVQLRILEDPLASL